MSSSLARWQLETLSRSFTHQGQQSDGRQRMRCPVSMVSRGWMPGSRLSPTRAGLQNIRQRLQCTRSHRLHQRQRLPSTMEFEPAFSRSRLLNIQSPQNHLLLMRGPPEFES